MWKDKTLPVAHIKHDEEHQWLFHSLQEHLHHTAKMAKMFADEFDAGDWAYIAGLWHDIGKYREEFQQYIRASSDPEAHIEGAPKRVDHSTVGALLATQKFGETIGGLLAYLIAGHHAGLPDYETDEQGQSALKSRLQRMRQSGVLDRLNGSAPFDWLNKQEKPASLPPGCDGTERLVGLHLWLRMLFSCLTDADFLDTEAFMDARRSEHRQGWPGLDAMLPVFETYMGCFKADSPVNHIRAEVLQQCRNAASGSPGRYSLTVPT
ncbi:MAG: CRISPR-associated endonuclease Cas3'', partial [Candidatus Thiodiazotropha endolucinida]